MLEIVRIIFSISVLLLLSVMDLKRGIVPNKIVYPAMLISIILALLSPGASAGYSLLGGAILLVLVLIPAVILKGIAAGDIKLAGLIGLMVGFPAGLYALFGGIILGGLAAIILLLARFKGRKDEMPYAPYLSVGAIVVMLAGHFYLLPTLFTV